MSTGHLITRTLTRSPLIAVVLYVAVIGGLITTAGRKVNRGPAIWAATTTSSMSSALRSSIPTSAGPTDTERNISIWTTPKNARIP